MICVGETTVGSVVNAMKDVRSLCTPTAWVYDFKDTYIHLLEEYKSTRVQVFGNNRYYNTPSLALQCCVMYFNINVYTLK